MVRISYHKPRTRIDIWLFRVADLAASGKSLSDSLKRWTEIDVYLVSRGNTGTIPRRCRKKRYNNKRTNTCFPSKSSTFGLSLRISQSSPIFLYFCPNFQNRHIKWYCYDKEIINIFVMYCGTFHFKPSPSQFNGGLISGLTKRLDFKKVTITSISPKSIERSTDDSTNIQTFHRFALNISLWSKWIISAQNFSNLIKNSFWRRE
jgi:hypothetical protein